MLKNEKRIIRERIIGIGFVKRVKRESKPVFSVEWFAEGKKNRFSLYVYGGKLLMVCEKVGEKEVLGSEILWFDLKDVENLTKLKQIACALTGLIRALQCDEFADRVTDFYYNKFRRLKFEG